MPENSFTDRMKLVIKESGNIAKLSDKSGVSPRSISGYLGGSSDPTRKKLIAMAEAANVSVEWLATGRGVMRPGEKQCEHESLKLHRKGHLFEKDPGFNPEIMGQIYSQLSDFKENNSYNLTKEKEIDVLIMTYSLCQPEVRTEARLICSILTSIFNSEQR